jgi:quercetin dioxygenase-like cupin family protein
VLTRSRLAVAAAVALLPVTAVGAYAAGHAAQDAAPTAQRDDLALLENPAGAKGRTLGLSRVTIPPHTELALHRHPGNQIASIQRGTLTYTVRTGTVEVYRGPATVDAKPVRRVKAGQTARVHAGEWVVESPGDIHIGANRGSKPLVILLATLFPNGAPSSITVEDGQ